MGSERSYSLEVAVQPPTVARAGVPFYPPLVIRVHIRDAEGVEITGEDELSGLFAQATLYRESGSPPSLAPPDMYLLSGRLSMSLDLLNEPDTGPNDAPCRNSLGQQQGSYVLFPDLTVNRSGRYRLGISLFKVEGGRPMRSGASNGVGGGTTLEEAKTDVVFVQEGPVTTHTDAATQRFLDHLRGRGANVPSPPR